MRYIPTNYSLDRKRTKGQDYYVVQENQKRGKRVHRLSDT